MTELRAHYTILKAIHIVDRETQKVVKTFDVSKAPPVTKEQIDGGLIYKVDFKRFYTDDEHASQLPKDWRKRCEFRPRWPRFTVEYLDDDAIWQIIDWAYGTTLGHDTKKEATEAAKFARAYVKKHGDIDLGSFPYGLDQVLHYDSPTEILERWEAHNAA